MPSTARHHPTVKSADRTLDVLELLAATGRPIPHAEIARRTRIPKSSLTQLLRNLALRRYVTRGPEDDLFRLGDGALALARRGLQVHALVEAAQPLLEQFTRETGESSAISVLHEGMVERVCSAYSPSAVLYSLHPGVRAPLYAVSSGKMFLAWMTAQERESYYEHVKLVPFTAETIRSISVLRRQVRIVRSTCIAFSMGEFTRGIVGIAVPIFRMRDQVIAALSTALPQSRLDVAKRARLQRALQAYAMKLGKQLGNA